MTIVYVTDDPLKWGNTGLSRPLHAAEVDNNFWEIVERLLTLEGAPAATAGIDYFEVSGTSFYVHLTDATVLGPYELPIMQLNFRDEWQPSTAYEVNDTFTINGGFYRVAFPHTSDVSFDAGANDGDGHDFYELWMETPGNALPTGGAVGQVVEKSAVPDFSVTWGWKSPIGGITGQVPVKQSSTQDDWEWDNLNAVDIEFDPVTGSPFSSDNVADALEEIVGGGAMAAAEVTYEAPSGSGRTSTNVQDAIDEIAGTGSAGRQTMWVPAKSMSPLLSDGAAVGVVETASRKNLVQTLDFDATNEEGCQFDLTMPKSWDKGDLYFKVYWLHGVTVTAFGVQWQIYGTVIEPGTDFDQSMSFVEINDTGGIEDLINYSDESADPLSIDATADNAIVLIQVWRDPADVADTLTIDAKLYGVQVYYNTLSGTDD